jgi:hypothetical protein
MASAKARDFLNEKDEGNEGRAGKGKATVEKTIEFGQSLTTEVDLKRYSERGWIEVESFRVHKGKTKPKPKPHPNKAVLVNGVVEDAQFARCTFIPMRQPRGEK